MTNHNKHIVSILDVSHAKHHTEKQSEQHEGAALNHRSSQEETEQEELLQKRLWNEDATLCPKEEIAEFLGSPK